PTHLRRSVAHHFQLAHRRVRRSDAAVGGGRGLELGDLEWHPMWQPGLSRSSHVFHHLPRGGGVLFPGRSQAAELRVVPRLHDVGQPLPWPADGRAGGHGHGTLLEQVVHGYSVCTDPRAGHLSLATDCERRRVTERTLTIAGSCFRTCARKPEVYARPGLT